VAAAVAAVAAAVAVAARGRAAQRARGIYVQLRVRVRRGGRHPGLPQQHLVLRDFLQFRALLDHDQRDVGAAVRLRQEGSDVPVEVAAGLLDQGGGFGVAFSVHGQHCAHEARVDVVRGQLENVCVCVLEYNMKWER